MDVILTHLTVEVDRFGSVFKVTPEQSIRLDKIVTNRNHIPEMAELDLECETETLREEERVMQKLYGYNDSLKRDHHRHQ